jgi:pyridoxamine 5'-phosphate oxidase-like protein
MLTGGPLAPASASHQASLGGGRPDRTPNRTVLALKGEFRHAGAMIAGKPFAPAPYPFTDDPAGRLGWDHVETRLTAALNYWLGTANLAAVPHATPVWGVWLDGALYFDGHPQTRWARDLAANPRLTVHLESGDDVVIIEGLAEDLTTDSELAGRIASAWLDKYGRLAPEPDTRGLFRLRPRSARAWSMSTLEDGTRWVLD